MSSSRPGIHISPRLIIEMMDIIAMNISYPGSFIPVEKVGFAMDYDSISSPMIKEELYLKTSISSVHNFLMDGSRTLNDLF